MKTIGLLGGMSWESTASYYQTINQEIKHQLGGLHSAKIALYSVDFHEIEALQKEGDWDEAGRLLALAAKNIEAGSADFLVICTNTMHKVVSRIESEISIPILHIADATAEAMVKDKIKTIGLIGTSFTMEQNFYKGRIKDKYNIKVLIPDKEERNLIHRVIFEELCLGKVNQASRTEYLKIMDRLVQNGAEAVILGCTEIALLVNEKHTDIKLYDTTDIHAQKAVQWSIGQVI